MKQDSDYDTAVREENHDEAVALLSKNGYEIGEYNPHEVSAWLIQNDHTRCLVIGSNEQEAIDNAVNGGHWDSQKMSEEDLEEYESNGWTDSFVRAGNASEAFWAENIAITLILTA